MSVAGVAHPVERHLAKVEVASSSLVTRSMKTVSERKRSSFLFSSKIGSKNQHNYLLHRREGGGMGFVTYSDKK